jgi:hypothetical protein
MQPALEFGVPRVKYVLLAHLAVTLFMVGAI